MDLKTLEKAKNLEMDIENMKDCVNQLRSEEGVRGFYHYSGHNDCHIQFPKELCKEFAKVIDDKIADYEKQLADL